LNGVQSSLRKCSWLGPFNVEDAQVHRQGGDGGDG